MSRLRQLAEGIHSSNENTSTKRYKSGSGSAISPSVDAAADAQGRVPVAGRCCVVNGRAVMVCGAEPVAALEAAEKFVKQRTQDAPCSRALARVSLLLLQHALDDFDELRRQHEASPLSRPVEECLLCWRASGLPWNDFAINVLFREWLPKEQAGGLQPDDVAWVVGQLGRGSATLADASGSKAGACFSACLLANGLLPSDPRLLFSNLVPSSNEEVERQHWAAAEQMEEEEAAEEAAGPAHLQAARLAHARALGAAYAAGQELPAMPQLPTGPAPLVQPPPPLPPGRGPDPVIHDEADERAALLYQLIQLQIARICGQDVRALLLATPLAVPVMCGVQASDEQLLGTAPPPQLRSEVRRYLPNGILILTPYPTGFGSRWFVDVMAVHRVLANLPAGASLPFGRFQARGVLTAVQHTVALERCVQAVGEVRQALGEAAPPLAEGYATAMQRLQAVDSPHLHCMALPGGSGGSLPALVRRALESTAVLGIEYHLGEERDQRHEKHCRAAAEPPPANEFTKAAIKAQDEQLAALMAPRLAQAQRLQREALLLPSHAVPQAVGAGFGNALMVAGCGAMDPLHIRVGDCLIAFKPNPDGKLDAYPVEAVEVFLARGTYRIHQGYKVADAKSAGSPGSFELVLTAAVGIVLGYNTTQTETAASSECTVLARHAERERRRRRTQQRKVVLCLDGEYPDVPQNLAHIMLTLARECCAQEYRRRGQDPDEFLAPLADLHSISIEELGYLDGATFGDAAACDGSMIYSASDRDSGVLRDYCSLLDKLWLQPVAWHDKGTSIRVRGSTASRGRVCEQSWVLGADGEPLLDEQGQRVHPLSNDWDVNILVQFFVLMGNIDGSTRTLQQHMLSLRLMQPPRYLRPALGGGADTDGWYNKPEHAIKIGQGRLCGHDSQTAYYSGAALRCGLGGLVTVSSGNYHVCMRGARLPELREFIKVPHKQPPAEVNKTKFKRAGLGDTYQRSDPHLRRFRVEEQEGLQLCVRIRLAGGPQLVRAACGAGLLLGG